MRREWRTICREKRADGVLYRRMPASLSILTLDLPSPTALFGGRSRDHRHYGTHLFTLFSLRSLADAPVFIGSGIWVSSLARLHSEPCADIVYREVDR